MYVGATAVVVMVEAKVVVDGKTMKKKRGACKPSSSTTVAP
jgi:hypothetical protein